MAFYGYPISQCQSLSTPLAYQLRSGIRVIDIRLSFVDGRLMAYHGIYPQNSTFTSILATLYDFMTSPESCRETLVMSVKQEDFMRTSGATFSRRMHKELAAGPGGLDMWFLENRVPTLGEVRGKVVLFSRFGDDGGAWEGGNEGIGIHPSRWPDSERWGFSWDCKNTIVRTQDWYEIGSFLYIQPKTEVATALLLPPPNSPPVPTLSITFLSAASFPLALPKLVACGLGWPRWFLGFDGVNARAVAWLTSVLAQDGNARIRGWPLMDFYEEAEVLVPLLIECNFRGRVPGEEGWV